MDSTSQTLREKYLDDPLVTLESPFVDARGAIYPIVDEVMESCVIISSKTGTVRANHYHKTDWHYCYVMEGEIQYHWRSTGDESAPRVATYVKGECFFTPPMVDHAMVFSKDTTFLTLGRNPRDQKTYEEDIERIDLVQV
ncbi:MAG: cupin domain-containing protein [Halioglobus sp.]